MAFREYTQANAKKLRRGTTINVLKCIFIAVSRFLECSNKARPIIISTTTGEFGTVIGWFSVDG
jgi:hypothetical protein